MATWDDVAIYLRTNYKIVEDKGTVLALVFDVGDGRSQLLHVSRGSMPSIDEDFAEIASPIADAASVDVAAVLKEASKLVIGGIVQYGEKLVLRHTVPLANVDANEFIGPLEVVTTVADMLEKKYTGSDEH